MPSEGVSDADPGFCQGGWMDGPKKPLEDGSSRGFRGHAPPENV